MVPFLLKIGCTNEIKIKVGMPLPFCIGAVPLPPITWTLVLNFDPNWIGNSQTCVAVSGYLMSSGKPIAPWIPPGTQ